MTEYRFVLVHGSWHTARPWKPVADQLDVAGHRVTRRRSPATARTPTRTCRTTTACASIVDHIVDGDFDDVVLVGHSFGGTVIARVAGEIPERIRRLVFWNAFVPEDGNCLNDEVPPHYQELFDGLAEGVRRQHGHAAVADLARGVHQRRRRGARALGLRAALARAVPLLHRQARPRRVLRVRDPAQLSQLHRGHRAAARRSGAGTRGSRRGSGCAGSSRCPAATR